MSNQFENVEKCYFAARTIKDFILLKKIPSPHDPLDLQISFIEQWQANRIAGEKIGVNEAANMKIIVDNILKLNELLTRKFGNEWILYFGGSFMDLDKGNKDGN